MSDFRGKFLVLIVAKFPKMGDSSESPSLKPLKHNGPISLYPSKFSKLCVAGSGPGQLIEHPVCLPLGRFPISRKIPVLLKTPMSHPKDL